MEPPKGIVGTSQEAEKAWRPITFRTFLRCNAVPRRVFVRGQLSGCSPPIWRLIVSVAAATIGLVMALAITLARRAGAMRWRARPPVAWVLFRGHRTGRQTAAFCIVDFPRASEVPMTHSEERIYSILSLAAIGLGLVLALALAYS
jgi:hypothetical protein